MRRMAPGAAFHIAVKHLFRHLHDCRALEKNTLVRHFFADPHLFTMQRCDREQMVLARIHESIRRGSEEFFSRDVEAGKGERAYRRHVIILQQCLERRSIQDVATDLGISYYHCYREKAAICMRVAQYVMDHSRSAGPALLAEVDEFQMLRSRTLNGAADAATSYREAAELVRVAPSLGEKIEALGTSALIAIRFGDAVRARESLVEAEALYAERFVDSSSQAANVARAFIDLIAAKLARDRADSRSALAFAQRATSLLDTMSGNAAPYVREMHAESLLELGAAFCAAGALDRAYDSIAAAESHLARVRSASFQLRTRIATELWRLRSCLLTNPRAWRPSSERISGLTAALDDARSVGALSEAANIAEALTLANAAQGNDDEALRTGRFAIAIARRQPNCRVFAHTAIRVVISLLNTRHWESALALLPDRDCLESSDSHHRAVTRFIFAEHALRTRQLLKARRLTAVSEVLAGNALLLLYNQLVAASAEHALGCARKARSLVDSAIPEAERMGAVDLLRDTYRVASQVTRERRFTRLAGEYNRLLSG
jgi:hypothetical protein